jgi:cytidylate kinase
MIKVCISGFTSSGKTTVAELVAATLGITHIHKSYKEYVKSEFDIAKFTDGASEEFVRSFDNEIKRMADESASCVLSTWLAPWFVKDATLRVWLYASLEERSKRWAKTYNTDLKTAEKLVTEKDQSEIESIRKIYGIDLNDRSIFDIVVNTGLIGPQETADIVYLAARASEKRDAKN